MTLAEIPVVGLNAAQLAGGLQCLPLRESRVLGRAARALTLVRQGLAKAFDLRVVLRVHAGPSGRRHGLESPGGPSNWRRGPGDPVIAGRTVMEGAASDGRAGRDADERGHRLPGRLDSGRAGVYRLATTRRRP